MRGFLRRLALYLRTVRWLRVSQLAYFVYRRIRPVSNPAPVPVESHRTHLFAVAGVTTPEPERAEFQFINMTRSADPDAIDWVAADMPKLWTYNLHYFEYLLWEVIPAEFKPRYVDGWIAANPPGTVNAWEPYSVSLRIVNWIKYFDSLEAVPEQWNESLLHQAHWLTHNLEYHILANHLMKNAKALVFAGAWFDGPRGHEILHHGLRLFVAQLSEQILPDGGHYERSPMYHAIALEDCLDVANLLQARPELATPQQQEAVTAAATRAMRFFDDLLLPDGHIALFNDAAHGIAPPSAALLGYGERLLNYERAPRPLSPVLISKPDTGYYGYHAGGDSMLIDCGEVGPAYQPGHAHCDTLSYELCLDGSRLVVDPGMHGYHYNEFRPYLRSTAAHNTVRVNGREQSEIWGHFRVARRAMPGPARLSSEQGIIEFTGSHDGYCRLPEKVLHSRTIRIDPAGAWTVSDQLAGSGECQAESFVHLDPGIEARCVSPDHWELLRGGRAIATIRAPRGGHFEAEAAYICPGFNVRLEAMVLVLRFGGPLPLESGYEIRRV